MHAMWLVIGVVLVYYAVTRLLPQLLSWLLIRRYNLQISMGKIGLHPLCIYKVCITRGPIKISAEWVNITSSLFSSQVHRPLALCLHGVLLELQTPPGGATSPAPQSASPLPTGEKQSGRSGAAQLLSLGQFTGVYLYNLRAVYGQTEKADVQADSVTVEGTNTIHNELTVVLRVASLRADLSRRLADQKSLTLARFIAELEVQTTLLQESGRGPVQLIDVSVKVTRPDMFLSDQLLLRLNRHRSEAKYSDDEGDCGAKESGGKLPAWTGKAPRAASLTFSNLLLTSLHGETRLMTQLSSCRLELSTVSCTDQLPVQPTAEKQLAEATASLKLEEWSVESEAGRLAGLGTLQFSVRGVELNTASPLLEVAVGCHTLQLAYHHVEVSDWLAQLGLAPPSARRPAAGSARSGSAGGGLASRWRARLDVELWDVECGFSLPGLPPVSSSLTHGKLGGTAAGGELVLETLSCCLGAAEASARRHVVGAVLVLGVLLLNHKKTDERVKIGLMLDGVQLEGSAAAARLVQFAVSCLRWFRPKAVYPMSTHTAAEEKKNTAFMAKPPDINVQASNLTLCSVIDQHCTVSRIGSIAVERTSNQLSATLERLALAVGRSVSSAPLSCHKGAELSDAVCRLARVRVRQRERSETGVSVRESVVVKWSPTMHRHVKRTIDSAIEWVEFVKRRNSDVPNVVSSEHNYRTAGDLSDSSPTDLTETSFLSLSSSSSCSPPSSTSSPSVEPSPASKLTIKVKADFSIDALLISKHRFGVTLSDITAIRDGDVITVTSSEPKFLFDGHPIVLVKGLRVERSGNNKATAARRAPIEELSLKENMCWEWNVAKLSVSVPYGYDFASAWNEELNTAIKWLKRLHGGARTHRDGPLPADLFIVIGELSMEVCDDPLEVKLRDNYELLEDEHNESVKRRTTLDAKIEEQRRLHGLLQARKVEALYNQLQQRDAELFVQRAQKMYEETPMRTRLFLWTMEGLELAALADPCLHGRAACIANLRRIDPLTPWPEDDLQFCTLWCREVVTKCSRWSITLRDYPQKMLDIQQMHLWGRLLGAEQEAGPRASRQVTVELDAPFAAETVDRSLQGMKFYYDLSSDVDHFVAAYGPCWEPAMAFFNQCMERINPPSKDPSQPLSWWDKARFKLHGRITQSVQQQTLLLHASLDPYNTTEEMEITFSDLVMDWSDGKLVYKGDFSVYVRTASKYDDCRLLFVPNLKLSVKMDWLSMGDPRDHHSVLPCAADKLPEYSSNQEHDSYRAYRSQNLNMSISLETRPAVAPQGVVLVPTVLLYGSTVKWFENLKFILSGVTRPTRRGAVFNNVKPRKQQLSRHYKYVRLSLNLHSFQVSYWMSFTRQHGLDIRGDRVSLSSEHRLSLRPVTDGLLHRPRAHWAVEYVNCELNDAEVWLQSSLDTADRHCGEVEKWFFMSVARVSYGRAAVVPTPTHAAPSATRDTPTHRLVVHNMKAAWTKNNRDAGFALFDSFASNQQLRRNLSTGALKGLTIDSSATGERTPLKSRPDAAGLDASSRAAAGGVTSPGAGLSAGLAATPSPMSRLQSGQAASMLEKLVAESSAVPVAFSEDVGGAAELHEQSLRGVAACHSSDVLHNNWLIELVNCQVLLKGIETKGYVIITSSKSQILQRVHRPVWRDRTLVSKTSWVGGLEGMQYYATVSAGEKDPTAENIMWLTVDNIVEKDHEDIREVPDLVGSGQSVGGVVTETVGGCAEGEDHPDSIQLQRVVSRCRCEFLYLSYGEESVDPDSVDTIPPLPQSPSGIWPSQEQHPVDALTVTHHDLKVCTNSLQYSMVLDIVNNLLLYVAPRKRQSLDQQQRMRFQMQLSSIEDQRKPIQQLQNRIRAMMCEIRQLEKATYTIQRQQDEAGGDRGTLTRLQAEVADKERQTLEKKELLSTSAEELAMRIHIYKETQLSQRQKPTTRKGGESAMSSVVIRSNEVIIRHAQWRLTDSDGQLGIADLVLSGYCYNKDTKNDGSIEHSIELGYINMSNLLPNQAYRDVLQPSELHTSMPVDRQRSLRVYFRERPPVGGISVKEHLEINITPLHIGMTYQFFKIMLKFCFPERDTEHLEEEQTPKEKPTKKEKKKQKKESSFYVAIEKDDVEKMKERARNNMLFIYIKMPEVTVRVSYKGEKEKNLEDVHNFQLTIPTLEYHNVTWTWLDLLLAMKNDTKRVLLSQAIKQKLQIGGRTAGGGQQPLQDEQDKARMLFGSLTAPGSEKEKPSKKQGLFHHLSGN